jgi:hypothetical protein
MFVLLMSCCGAQALLAAFHALHHRQTSGKPRLLSDDLPKAHDE